MNEDKTGKGLNILILWNNRLTKNSSPYISRIIVCIKRMSCGFLSSLFNHNVGDNHYDNFFCDFYKHKLLITVTQYTRLLVSKFYLTRIIKTFIVIFYCIDYFLHIFCVYIFAIISAYVKIEKYWK